MRLRTYLKEIPNFKAITIPGIGAICWGIMGLTRDICCGMPTPRMKVFMLFMGWVGQCDAAEKKLHTLIHTPFLLKLNS